MEENAMKNERQNFTGVPLTYRELVAMHPPRQIRTQAECDAATRIVEKMAGHALNADQEDYLDLLSTLVSQYDEAHHPVHVGKMSPTEALKYVMQESGMNASDLGRLLGNRELGSKILRGERGLSMNHITILAEHFAVSPELFMPSIPKARAGSKAQTQWRGKKTNLRDTSR